jgi:hypothetical protein
MPTGPPQKTQSVTSVKVRVPLRSWTTMKKIFAILVIVFALTTAMAAATVITYTNQASACAPDEVC